MIRRRQFLRLCALGASLLGLVVGSSAFAATITVNSLADPGSPGVCVLRDAITAANTKTATNGCAAGTGSDTINFLSRMTGTILLVSALPQDTDNLLTINGPGSLRITIRGGDKVQVLKIAAGATLNLNNLIIANSSTIDGEDGGIFNSGTLNVTNSTFSGNNGEHAGAIFNNGALTITNSTFSNNEGSVTGGIFNNGTLTISKSTFSDDGSSTSGGGIHNLGMLTVINSTFSSNNANGSAGAIDNWGALMVTDSTFSDNGAISASAILNENTGTATINKTTFSGNAGFFDGAIFNGGIMTVTNSTLSGNVADSDASAIGNGGILTVTNSTFAGNRASGRAVRAIANITGQVSLKSTILANNDGGNCGGGITDLGYNISDEASCGFTAVGSMNNTDPMLDPAGLANNGGPTQTIALQSGSSAIDAIPVAKCTDQASPLNPITTDQRGFRRPDRREPVCDIGAYEFQD